MVTVETREQTVYGPDGERLLVEAVLVLPTVGSHYSGGYYSGGGWIITGVGAPRRDMAGRWLIEICCQRYEVDASEEPGRSLPDPPP